MGAGVGAPMVALAVTGANLVAWVAVAMAMEVDGDP